MTEVFLDVGEHFILTLFTVSRPTPLFPHKVRISVRVTTCLLVSLEKLSRGELRWLLHIMAIVQEIVTESRELEFFR